MEKNGYRPLTDAELYRFDTSGVLRRPGFISAEQCVGISEMLQPLWPVDTVDPHQRIDKIAQLPVLSGLLKEIVTNSGVYDTINQPMRLIESYALRRGSGSVQALHNGRSNDNRSRYGISRRTMWREHTYHDGLLYCMMVKVLVYLSDVNKVEDGPFVIIEGSHKSNYPYPVSRTEMAAGVGLDDPAARPMMTSAGDLLLLNEAATHGSLAKSSEGGFRTLLAFSFAPSFVGNYSRLSEYDDIDELGFFE